MMYLINVDSMQLESFLEADHVKYAILSHRWRAEEVLFQDMQAGTAHQKAGFAKLKRFCEEAAALGCRYAWCDTCCIDKSSSSDLSEAINSMFQWYQTASVCLAYLFDVRASTADHDSSEFGQSAWFTRGWCLQELLAPRSLYFFNSTWERLGTKQEFSWTISKITKIHQKALSGRHDLGAFSVAEKMSWAADRVTTRTEDLAYSLLGIFGVNMALLYGEGRRAFIRLQEEIIKQSDDQSIFVHSAEGEDQGLLATSPADFRNSTDILCGTNKLVGEPYNLTNMGLSIELALYPWTLGVYVALLDCGEFGSLDKVGIYVKLKSQQRQRGGQMPTDRAVRIKIDGQSWISHPAISKLPVCQRPLYIEHRILAKKPTIPKRYGFWIRRFEGENDWAKSGKLWAVSWNPWNSAERVLEMPNGIYATAGIVVWENPDAGAQHQLCLPLRLAFSPTFEPVIEFAGEKHLGGYDLQQKRIDPSQTATYLSDMTWMADRNPGRGNGILIRGGSRDAPILKTGKWGMMGAVNINCQKLLVQGTLTWVLDVVWRLGSEGLPRRPPFQRTPRHRPAARYRGAICDACGGELHGARYKCVGCVDFDLCVDCIEDAEKLHDVDHEFVLRDE